MRPLAAASFIAAKIPRAPLEQRCATRHYHDNN
jgi:hypothetical protein